jgi:hypothetical protein
MRIERAVAVAPFQRAAAVGRPHQPGVSHAAGGVGIASAVKTKMVRRRRAIVNAAVSQSTTKPEASNWAWVNPLPASQAR